MQALHKGRSVRLLLAVLFFGGLAALEVAAGVERWSAAQERHREELLDLVDRQQEALAREVADLLGAGNRHALHLSKNPFVRELLAAPDAGAARSSLEALARLARPYLASFHELDRLSVFDARQVEAFRCERMGGGVATLPAAMLAPSPSAEVTELLRLEGGAGVAVSALVHDAGRVEVAENERWVFRLVAAVDDGDTRIGAVAVTIYAGPLLHALAAFKPLAGTTTCLLDDSGQVFASEPGGEEPGGVAALVREQPQLARRLLSESGRIAVPAAKGVEGASAPSGATLLVRPTGVQPASRLVSAVPRSSLGAGELAVTLGTALRSLVVIAVIGLGSAFFVRASLRAARLREAEAYLARIAEESRKQRALMEAAADLILIVEPESERLDDWNPRARAALALELAPGESPTLQALLERMGAEDRARLRDALGAASGQAGVPATARGLRLALDDGQGMEADARCIGLEYGGRRYVEIALADRTREREMERRAQTAERLSSLGLVAAGVAHEINNPLEGIANYLALVERTADPEKRGEYLAQVRRGFQRIRDITSELLPIARAERGTERADLRRVVERVAGMARLTRDFEGLDVEQRIPDEVVLVRGGEGRVEQVLLNLLLNAARVTSPGGRVRVEVDASEPTHAEIRVEDEGPGIDPQDLDHLFDPFFSRTGGTGLGLSVSYGIAKALGGELVAENRAEGGARFRLRLRREEREERDAKGGVRGSA